MRGDSSSTRMRTGIAIVATLLVVATWTPPSAQSLADVARAEAVRRAAVTRTSPVITDKDLEPVRQPAPADRLTGPAEGAAAETSNEAGPSPADAEDVAADGGEAAPAPAAPERRDEQYWRTRFTDTRQAVNRAVRELDAVQGRIRQLDAELDAGPPAARRSEIVRERSAADAVIGRLQTRVANVRAEFEALQNFARSRDVPADWTR